MVPHSLRVVTVWSGYSLQCVQCEWLAMTLCGMLKQHAPKVSCACSKYKYRGVEHPPETQSIPQLCVVGIG